MVAVDATNPSSPGLKLLRSYLNNARMEFLEVNYESDHIYIFYTYYKTNFLNSIITSLSVLTEFL